MTPDIERLRDVIKQLHGCDSVHLSGKVVIERFEGQDAWTGVVELFKLNGHPTAELCYAWSYTKDDGSERYFAVLHLPPVVSAQTAVRAAIVSDFKNRPN
jgi:hypothetical protein